MISNFEKMEAKKKANYAEMRKQQARDERRRQAQAAQFKVQQDEMKRQQQYSLREMQEPMGRNAPRHSNLTYPDCGERQRHQEGHIELAKAMFLATAGLTAAKVAGANLTWKQVFAPVIIWLALIFGVIFLVGVLFALAMLARS